MALAFFKRQRLSKVIGLLRALHCGFDNHNASSINHLWSANTAGDAHEHSPTRMHANTKGCVFHCRDTATAMAGGINRLCR